MTDKPTIIFGADVTHPPPGEDSSSSIAAVSCFISYHTYIISSYLTNILCLNHAILYKRVPLFSKLSLSCSDTFFLSKVRTS